MCELIALAAARRPGDRRRPAANHWRRGPHPGSGGATIVAPVAADAPSRPRLPLPGRTTNPIHTTTRPTMSTAADVTDAQWESTVLQSTEPVFVDFWAEWCAPCRAMSPAVDRLAEEFDGKLTVVKINTTDNPEVPARYGITAIPTFLIIKGGEVVKQLVGSQSYAQLKAEVEGFVD